MANGAKYGCEHCKTKPGSTFCIETCIPAWKKALEKIFPKQGTRIEDLLEDAKTDPRPIFRRQVA